MMSSKETSKTMSAAGTHPFLNTYELVFTALIAALLCIAGPLSVQIGPIPVTLTNLVIFFSVTLLGMKIGSISCGIYLLLGMAGLPVFSGGAGGLGKLVGPTGGFLIGFFLMALLGGWILEKTHRHYVTTILGWVVACLLDYAFGTLWFVLLMHCSAAYALSVCVLPFAALDFVKILLATIVGKSVRSILIKQGIFND